MKKIELGVYASPPNMSLKSVFLKKLSRTEIKWFSDFKNVTYLARFKSESFDGSYGDSFDGISRIVGIGAVCDSITCRAISA